MDRVALLEMVVMRNDGTVVYSLLFLSCCYSDDCYC